MICGPGRTLKAPNVSHSCSCASPGIPSVKAHNGAVLVFKVQSAARKVAHESDKETQVCRG